MKLVVLSSMINRISLVFLVILFIGILAGIGELFRLHVSGKDYVVQQLFCLSVLKIKLIPESKVFSCFTKAADSMYLAIADQYHFISVPNSRYVSTSLPDRVVFDRQFVQYVGLLQISDVFSVKNNPLPRIFYNAAIMAQQTGEKELIEPLLKTAILLQPELSHYHLELANYYLMENRSVEALELIKYCTLFVHPRAHCRQFEETNIKHQQSERFGFFKPSIDEYYALP